MGPVTTTLLKTASAPYPGDDAFSHGETELVECVGGMAAVVVDCLGDVLESGDPGEADGEVSVEVKLAVFLSNTKSRRAKLTADKLAALAELGLNWA
jgi:hypothetical protein